MPYIIYVSNNADKFQKNYNTQNTMQQNTMQNKFKSSNDAITQDAQEKAEAQKQVGGTKYFYFRDLPKGFDKVKWDEGDWYIKLLSQPVDGKHAFNAVIKYLYSQTSGYLLMDEKSLAAYTLMSIWLSKNKPNSVKTAKNPLGFDIRPKTNIVFMGQTLRPTMGTALQPVVLPYSDYEQGKQQAGNAVLSVITSKSFTGDLSFKGMLDVTGNVLRVSVTGQNDRREYGVSGDVNQYTLPDAILDTAFKFEDILQYAPFEVVRDEFKVRLGAEWANVEQFWN